MTRTAAIRSALTLVFLAIYSDGSRVIPITRLAEALGIGRSSAHRLIHAAARAAGVRLWRSAFGLVVEVPRGRSR